MTPARPLGNVPERPRAVLFDLDGTLIDSAPDLRASINILLRQYELGSLSLERVRGMIGNGIKMLVERAFDSCGHPLVGEEVDAGYAAMLDIYSGHLTTFTRPMPGARAAIRLLHAKGFRMGVVTNKQQAATERILDHFALTPFLGAVIGGSPGMNPKPAPDMLLRALDRLGVEPGDAVMVGDSGIDVEAAHNAGLPAVIVLNGYMRSSEEAAKAAVTIASLEECPAAVGAIWMFGRERLPQLARPQRPTRD